MCPIYVQRETQPDEHGRVLWSMCRRRSLVSGLCEQHEADMMRGKIAPVREWAPVPVLWLAGGPR